MASERLPLEDFGDRFALYGDELPPKRGKILMSSPLNVGRQEQMMPVFASALLQMAAIGFSHVISFACEIVERLSIRRIEIMHVLRLSVSSESTTDKIDAYKAASPNTAMRAIFCRCGKCSCFNKGNGKTAVAMSVAIFMLVLLNQTAKRGRQRPFGYALGFQNVGIGQQANTALKKTQPV